MLSLQYLLRESRAGKKADGADGSPLAFFHPSLFTYAPNRGPASTVPPSYIALGRACVAEDPLQRPTFDEVLYALDGVRRDAERFQEGPAMAAASAKFAMPEMEPDPDESSAMNSLEGILAAQATRLGAGRSNASGTGFWGPSGVTLPGGDMLGGVPSSALGGGPGSGLGGALGGIPLLGSDVLGGIPSSALGGGPGSGLGGTPGGMSLLGSNVLLASQAGSRPGLGGSCDS